MNRLLYIFIILTITVGCKKEVIEEQQGPAVFELKLSESEITIPAGQVYNFKVSFFKNNTPIKSKIFGDEVNYKVTLTSNTTNDSFYFFPWYYNEFIPILAPQKEGRLTVSIQGVYNGLIKGASQSLIINVTNAPINYKIIDKEWPILYNQLPSNKTEYIFTNGIVFNQTNRSFRKIDFTFPDYDLMFYRYTDSNEFLLKSEIPGRIAKYNPITNQFSINSYAVPFTDWVSFRDLIICRNRTTNDMWRINSTGKTDYLGRGNYKSILDNNDGFFIYNNAEVKEYLSDTSATYTTYSLPTNVDYVKKVNNLFYLFGSDAVYSSTSGKSNWIKVIDFSNIKYPVVKITSSSFYILDKFSNKIYKTDNLNSTNLTPIDLPMPIRDFMPLDNGDIIFSPMDFSFMGLITP